MQRIGRRAYKAMPVPDAAKIKIAHMLFLLAGPLFKGMGHYESWRGRSCFSKTQDMTFPVDLYCAKKVMVFLVPEHNVISGGIFSMFSIANQMWRLRHVHGYEVLVMTRPNPLNVTYFRNTTFRNSDNVYRFEQILLCREAEDVYLHIPEYAAATFMDDISFAERDYLKSRKNLYTNLLNQNIKLMPEKEQFERLRRLCNDNISQSVAHHAYFTKFIANKYQLPTLLLPAYTDLSSYSPLRFPDKDDLIIYSPDEAPYKHECLNRIAREFPHFQLIEIQNMSFDKFMGYATRCLFSITFGEGFDGYIAQPIMQGGIGFAAYNDEFFPSPHFQKYANIFKNGDDMVVSICDRIKRLSADRLEYETLNAALVNEYQRLYDFETYARQVEKLAQRQFELFPQKVRGIA
jgi:hypothetical protein